MFLSIWRFQLLHALRRPGKLQDLQGVEASLQKNIGILELGFYFHNSSVLSVEAFTHRGCFVLFFNSHYIFFNYFCGTFAQNVTITQQKRTPRASTNQVVWNWLSPNQDDKRYYSFQPKQTFHNKSPRPIIFAEEYFTCVKAFIIKLCSSN